ncbi:unnamed protein product [Rhizophagus irregularis]|nr:unnamed protein product [Rhizophagus irregularis]CAB5107187.1 unnamed protein product [Rhizophagus irregularis]
MPTLVIQWNDGNDAGFNDVATSPGNRNGVDRNAMINHLVTGGNKPSRMDNRVRHQTGIPDVVNSYYRINKLTTGGVIDVEIYITMYLEDNVS